MKTFRHGNKIWKIRPLNKLKKNKTKQVRHSVQATDAPLKIIIHEKAEIYCFNILIFI